MTGAGAGTQAADSGAGGRSRRRRWLWVYLAALLLSQLVQRVIPEGWYRLESPSHEKVAVEVEGLGRVGLAYIEWPAQPQAGEETHSPVILLHGSPGRAMDFGRFGPELAAAGYRTIAVDQLGFGESSRWVRDYSILSNAGAVLALMDALGIGRAHVVGWSNGGGTALHVADLAPDRVASITMMASIGLQEHEGSGSYFFEHLKYGVGLAVLVGGGELTPHFGLLGPTWLRHSSMRFFWDSDQRPLRGVMERLRTPTLILHGRDDFLVHSRAAEEHHRVIGPSRLVMMDASHFLPFLQAAESAEHVEQFLDRHDRGGKRALRQEADLDPEPEQLFGEIGARGERLAWRAPWWLPAGLVMLVVWWRERPAAALAALLVSYGLVDFGVVTLGIALGVGMSCIAAWRRGRASRGGWDERHIIGSGVAARSLRLWKEWFRERPIRLGLGSRFVPGEQVPAFEAGGAVGMGGAGTAGVVFWAAAAVSWVLWAAMVTVITLVFGAVVGHPLTERAGELGLLAVVPLAVIVPRVAELLLTRTGRRILGMRLARVVRREYWPSVVFYAPLAPWIAGLAARHGAATFTCCNPAIGGGGGIIGESKSEILGAFKGASWVLPSVLVDPGGGVEERAATAIAYIENGRDGGDGLGGYPVVLKPDAGQRGFAVKLARDESDVRGYFRIVTTGVVVQRFHAGPEECGVLWARCEAAGEGRLGRIYSVTRKEFPFVVGDGRYTLEELIWRHPRHRRQAAVFLERFADERGRVPGLGESVRLAQAGNHCQGTLFRDGADLITPALEARIDELARGFRGEIDIGRFDLRYESDELLKRGEGFGVVEFNGAAGESTNIYDPDRSIVWSYRVLYGQWKLLYELGARRRRSGARPLALRELARLAGRHFRERRGSAVAD